MWYELRESIDCFYMQSYPIAENASGVCIPR